MVCSLVHFAECDKSGFLLNTFLKKFLISAKAEQWHGMLFLDTLLFMILVGVCIFNLFSRWIGCNGHLGCLAVSLPVVVW